MFTGLFSVSCADSPELDKATEALSSEQCTYFASEGKVTICHQTASTRKPYVILNTTVSGCEGHTGHAGDYVAVDGSICDGPGCFPEGASYDGSVECCEGLEPVDGYAIAQEFACFELRHPRPAASAKESRCENLVALAPR